MDIAELSRKLENMIRIGTIAEIDHAARRVRVDSGALTTDWLKWRAGRAGATLTWEPPTLGEQVMILSPSGELANGIVMPSIYSDAHDAPDSSPDTHVTQYQDGAVVSYNHNSGALSVTGIKSASIAASGNVSVECAAATVNCTGKAAVTAEGGIELDGDGAAQLKGILQGDCICMLTGAPHPHISATVKGSA
jgi:phage baseplate assembly protein V